LNKSDKNKKEKEKKIKEKEKKEKKEKPMKGHKKFSFKKRKDTLLADLIERYGEQEGTLMMQLVEECIQEKNIEDTDYESIIECISESIAERTGILHEEAGSSADNIGGHMALGGHSP